MLEPHQGGQQTVSFVLPESWRDKPAPDPSHPGLRIEDRPEMTVAALRFRGLWRDQRVHEQTDLLREILQREGLVASGGCVLRPLRPAEYAGDHFDATRFSSPWLAKDVRARSCAT